MLLMDVVSLQYQNNNNNLKITIMKTLRFFELDAEQKDSACEQINWILASGENYNGNIREEIEQGYCPDDDFSFLDNEDENGIEVIHKSV